MADLTWIEPDRARIGDVEFVCGFQVAEEACRDRFPVRKRPVDVEHYVELLEGLNPRTILEMGGQAGGSAAMLWLLVEPEVMAVVDIGEDPAPFLDLFAAEKNIETRLLRYWSTDQSNVEALDAVMARTFGDEPIDLIIDDASHLLAPTRISFDRTFPRLRPGGRFVIEDWSHDHLMDSALEAAIAADPAILARLERHIEESGPEAAPDPLSVFVYELVLAAACRPDVVSSIEIDDSWVVLTRGEAELTVGEFALAHCIGRRGGQLIQALEGRVPGIT